MDISLQIIKGFCNEEINTFFIPIVNWTRSNKCKPQ